MAIPSERLFGTKLFSMNLAKLSDRGIRNRTIND